MHAPIYVVGGLMALIGLVGLAPVVAEPQYSASPQKRTVVPFAMGADLSLLQFIQDHGVQYKEGGQIKDPVLIFREHGCNFVRLRLFVHPNGKDGQVNTLPYTVNLARRVKKAGMRLLLDLHYSDGWADPSHQTMPAAWKNLSHPQLVDKVYTYTRETLAIFQRERCAPDIVEVGNEITNGMLWPDGGPISNTTWNNLTDLLKAGIRGVQMSAPHGLIMIHIDKGGSKDTSRWFFDNLQHRGVKFDVIGLSYYPFWHGTMSQLQNNLAFLSQAYKKPIIIVETSYDTWGGTQGTLPFPLTPVGQKAYLEELIRTVDATPGALGAGIFYWEPDWIMGEKWHGPRWSGQWEDRALFDHSGNMLPAMKAFQARPKKRLIDEP